jgi:hypothetical protein
MSHEPNSTCRREGEKKEDSDRGDSDHIILVGQNVCDAKRALSYIWSGVLRKSRNGDPVEFSPKRATTTDVTPGPDKRGQAVTSLARLSCRAWFQ